MVPRTHTTAPQTFGWIWTLAAAAAASGLVADYGFGEPVTSARVIRILLIASVGLFALSRVVLLFPGSEIGGRLRRWWVDYVLLIAAGVWWAIEPHREPVIARVGAVYVLTLGAGAAIAAALRALTERILAGRLSGLTWRIVGALAVMALVGGLVIALPACCALPVTGQKLSQYLIHVLDCTFVAASALTCTGLTPLEIGEYFSMPGLLALLVLMQIGGLIALVLGTALGARLRELGGGNGHRHAGRVLRWAIAFMIIAELMGAVILYLTWDSAEGSAFASFTPSSAAGPIDAARVLASAFHAVSAFCNGGLWLSQSAGSSWRWGLYGVILPLMVLGSIGAPTLFEVWERRRRADRRPLSGHAKWTLLGTLFLLIGGAALLWGIERTHWLQLRYPREDTPGRLRVETNIAPSQMHSHDAERAARLSALGWGEGLARSFLTSSAARTSGISTLRMDEGSLSPASRWVLMLLMLAGGGIGGTAGGIRLVTAGLCLRAILRPGRDEALSAAAWTVLGAMLLLIAAAAGVLLYRDVGTPEATLFESVSAACNVGFSTSLTRQLYVEAKVVLILTMLIGRAIPLGLLARLGAASARQE